MFVRVCMSIRMYKHVCVCVYVSMYVCKYVRTYVCMYVCMYVRICMNICMHLHVYMYAYILYRLEIGAILYSWVIFAMCFAVAAVVTDAFSSARLRCIGVYAVCLLSIDVQCELQHLIFVVTPLTNACTPLSHLCSPGTSMR